MCGIVGFIGDKPNSNSVLVGGLKNLEYRGYDSAGICLLDNGFKVVKAVGKVKNLEDKIGSENVESAKLGIAHTRWATHGEPCELNAHPHLVNDVCMVHNGIIENYHELKEMLIQNGYTFKSETDSEVAAALVDYCYKQSKDHLKALTMANKQIRGSFAFGILFNDDDSTLYAMRRNSPLIVGVNGDANENYIASDVPAILEFTNKYMLLNDDEIAVIKKDSVQVLNQNLEVMDREVLEAEMDANVIKKDGYEHFMLKEIFEEPKVVSDTINKYVKNDIDDLIANMPDFSKYKEVEIVACGSALYAGMIAKALLEKVARVRVNTEIASEFRYKNPILTKDTLVIFVSQSGETADTLAAVKMVNEQGIDTLAVVNVIGSSIAREAKYVCYTMAGVEVSVATTKAYCCQVALLSLISLIFAYNNGQVTKEEANKIIDDLKHISETIKTVLKEDDYLDVAKMMVNVEDVYFIGRGIDYSLCMEASLKLKEISYIHSEAYAAGELKHGTISLIEEGTPVIAICTDEKLYEKTISNVKEVKARGANVTLFVREDFVIGDDYYDNKIVIPKNDIFTQTIVSIVPLQLMAYEIAKQRGCEIDQPRNLAKSVTVE